MGTGLPPIVRKAAFTLVLATVAACTARPPGPAAVGGPVGAPGWYEQRIRVDGGERWYRLYVPATLRERPAVVLFLHGGTRSMRASFGERAGGAREWQAIARDAGFLLLVPNGTNARTGDPAGDRQNWNDVRPPRESGNPQADDLLFIDRVLDRVIERFDTDPQRVYVTGASNGGLMTYYLLMQRPERFAAGASFVANLPVDPVRMRIPASPTPLMIANGSADPLMPWGGGAIPGGRGLVRSTAATVDWWIEANRALRDGARTSTLPDADPDDGCRIRETRYPPGAGGAEVVFYALDGSGHALPSRRHQIPENFLTRRFIGPVCRDVEGARLAWRFLRRH